MDHEKLRKLAGKYRGPVDGVTRELTDEARLAGMLLDVLNELERLQNREMKWRGLWIALHKLKGPFADEKTEADYLSLKKELGL